MLGQHLSPLRRIKMAVPVAVLRRFTSRGRLRIVTTVGRALWQRPSTCSFYAPCGTEIERDTTYPCKRNSAQQFRLKGEWAEKSGPETVKGVVCTIVSFLSSQSRKQGGRSSDLRTNLVRDRLSIANKRLSRNAVTQVIPWSCSLPAFRIQRLAPQTSYNPQGLRR